MMKHLIVILSVCWSAAFAQSLTIQPQDTVIEENPASVPAGNTQLSAPRNYNNLIRSNAITRDGLFTVHKVEDNYYFEIADSLLGRDLLVVSRIAQGAAGMRREYTGYAGDQVGNTVIRFEKGPGHKLFLRRITFEDNAGDTSNAMYHAVVRSNLQPLVAAFGIGAYSPSGKGSVIDVTDYVNGDNDILFFNAPSRKTMKVGGLLPNMCYIKDINSFPLNLEIRTIKTYKETITENSFTMELNTSIVLLPREPMRKRFADSRVGYFSEHYTDYGSNSQGVKVVNYIKRWRLEPRQEDIVKYILGELVEPKKPIVFYIDPATPRAWVPYLMKGITDWQVAFEKAGFKNAIQARIAPDESMDDSWSLEDSRHSAIVYKPSTIANAAGPIITDPRSGEILETHINWYHNLMSILQEWYMIQCAPNDSRAQKMKLDEKLMGQIIRSVASHEVGHTLGLTHNFAASSSVPVERLRDRVWLAENGISPSIMDYSRFNYVAQPQDSVGERGLINRIGAYDLWAIEWGYRWFPQVRRAEEEIPILNKWIIEKMEDKRLRYGPDFSTEDPRTQTEDVGDNAMKAGEYGIKNLKRVVPNLIGWTYQENEGYHNLYNIYSGLVDQFGHYMNHALAYIGGVYETNKSVDQPGPVYEPVPVTLQLEAIDFLIRHALHTPAWLLDTAIVARLGQMPVQRVTNMQENVLNNLLGNTTLVKVTDAEIVYGARTYRMIDYIEDIDDAMWTELRSYDSISAHRRNLQRVYLTRLLELASPTSRRERYWGDVSPIVMQRLAMARDRIRRAIPRVKNHPMTVYHLKYLQERIEDGDSE